MRFLLIQFAVAALLITGKCGRVLAVAVADFTVATNRPSDYGYAVDWDYIYNYKGSSASAVDHYWILTAAHVADDGGTGNLTIGEETYVQQEVVLHSQAADPDGHLTADIALVRYDKPFPGYYALAGTVPVGSEVVICGYGRTGTVVSTSSTAYFTEDGTSHSNKYWGTNRIDEEDTHSSTTPIVATSKGFNISISRDRRNSKTTDYEAGCNIYDSGCGMFVEEGGAWRLAGHMVARSSTDENKHVSNFAAATKYYMNWIKSVIVDYDTDMNGMPDWWEAEHSVSDAAADPDGDGFSNYEEWVADTDPNLGSSHLAVSAYTNTSQLVFGSSEDRKYRVEFSETLTSQNWGVEVDWFDGTATQTVQLVSNADTNRFYRVRARLH